MWLEDRQNEAARLQFNNDQAWLSSRALLNVFQVSQLVTHAHTVTHTHTHTHTHAYAHTYTHTHTSSTGNCVSVLRYVYTYYDGEHGNFPSSRLARLDGLTCTSELYHVPWLCTMQVQSPIP